MFTEKAFVISTVLSLVFSGFKLSLSDTSLKITRLKKATEHGLVAFTIAIMAYLDMKVTPFWIIWLLIYYLHS